MRWLPRLGLACAGMVIVWSLSILRGQESKPPSTAETPKPEQLTKPPQPEPPKNLGTIVVHVPANATVWFGEQKMSQTGVERSYQSPPLEPGKTYAYTIKVSWPTAGGRDHAVEQDVTVRANQTSHVDFRPVAAPGAGQLLPVPLTPLKPPYPTPGRPVFPRRAYEGSGYR